MRPTRSRFHHLRGMVASLGAIVLGLLAKSRVESEPVARDSMPRPMSETEHGHRDPIADLVSYFRGHGIELEEDKELSFWWTVARPSGGDFRVAVAFKSFPISATEKQMQEALTPISLAFLLNVPARVAMSYPSQRGTRPDSTIISPQDEATKRKLLDLFDRYRLPAP